MALLLVPYNNGMRLGQGFNSFTQQTCIDNAVVGISSREDSQPITPATYIPIAGASNTTGPVQSQKDKTPVAELLSDLDTTISRYPSQIVSYSSKYVEKISDVSNDMNISGSLSIRYGEISGGGSGSYVNTDTFNSSDMNFIITVKVVNQTTNVKDQLQFWPIDKTLATQYNNTTFTDVYGDCYISGFQEGGQFTAVVSIKALDSSNKLNIAANAHLALQVGVGSVEATADVKIAKENLQKNSEVNITVNWSGGGQLKEGNDKWTIDTLQDVAVRFADLVAIYPQRTHAILSKYTALRGYLMWKGNHKMQPLDYEIAALYTSELLDVYMGYKTIWKDIHKMMQDVDSGLIELIRAPALKTTVKMPQAWVKGSKEGEPGKWVDGDTLDLFPPDFAGLDLALQTCRKLMIRIVLENDDITLAPELAIDKDRPLAYLRPQVFRLLLPVPPPVERLSTKLQCCDTDFGEVSTGEADGQVPYEQQNVLPELITGFSRFEILRSANNASYRQALRVHTASPSLNLATVHITNWSEGRGAQLLYTGLSSLMIPVNDEGIQGGSWETPQQTGTQVTTPATPAANVTVRHRIDFGYSYEEGPPHVVVALSGFDFSAQGLLNISVKADKIDVNGFDVVFRGIDSLRVARCIWFAHPMKMRGIISGSTETPWAPGLVSNAPKADLPATDSIQDHVRFLPKTFTRAPKIIMWISGFSFNEKTDKNLRLALEKLDITKRGFNWRAKAKEANLTGVSVSWLAFEQ